MSTATMDEREFSVGLARSLEPLLMADIRRYSSAIAPLCESPIETQMGVALFFLFRMARHRSHAWLCASEEARAKAEAEKGSGGDTYLVPQYRFQHYRIDWAVFTDGQVVFIECDGHDFHERTKEQAARDRQKDRAIQTAGIGVLRFTGSEIHRDASECALQVLEFILARRAPR